jgi:hypothetical protein
MAIRASRSERPRGAMHTYDPYGSSQRCAPPSPSSRKTTTSATPKSASCPRRPRSSGSETAVPSRWRPRPRLVLRCARAPGRGGACTIDEASVVNGLDPHIQAGPVKRGDPRAPGLHVRLRGAGDRGWPRRDRPAMQQSDVAGWRRIPGGLRADRRARSRKPGRPPLPTRPGPSSGPTRAPPARATSSYSSQRAAPQGGCDMRRRVLVSGRA